MWVYENHLGGYYFTEERQDMDSLYCEECGDSDLELGEANTAEEFWDLIKENVNILDSYGMSGGMCEGYIRQVLREEFKFEDDDKLTSWLVDEWIERQRDKEKKEYWYGDEETPLERLERGKDKDEMAIVCKVYDSTGGTDGSADDEDEIEDGWDDWHVELEVKYVGGIKEVAKEIDDEIENGN